jgi:hypothetical protein
LWYRVVSWADALTPGVPKLVSAAVGNAGCRHEAWVESANLAVLVPRPAYEVPASAHIQHQLLRDPVVILNEGIAGIRPEVSGEDADVHLQAVGRTGQIRVEVGKRH